MNDYRLFGLEMSPYSVKVRSVLRYKKLPHQWVVRSLDQMAEFQRYARLPLVPLLIDSGGHAQQDSTPIIEALEVKHKEHSIYSGNAAMDFVSALAEEFADEWLNKPMFHFRWHYPEDADSAASRIATEMAPANSDSATTKAMAAGLRERMIGRLGFVGSSTETASLIERSFRECSQLLENHLATRDYLFGARPLLGDFGIYGQYKELLSDPTPARWLKENCPRLCAFVARMEDPHADGALETLSDLEPTLLPILAHIARWFVPWTQANAAALANNATALSVVLDGETFSQTPQKYHARSWAELKHKYDSCVGNEALTQLLQRSGLHKALTQ